MPLLAVLSCPSLVEIHWIHIARELAVRYVSPVPPPPPTPEKKKDMEQYIAYKSSLRWAKFRLCQLLDL